MIDFKYHITSLVAVFLALGIGVLIGSTMIGGDVIVQQQKMMVDQIEEDFRNFKEQNRILREDLMSFQADTELYQSYAHKIMPTLVTGRLTGKKIALFNASDRDIPLGVLQSLHLAGSVVTFYAELLSSEHLELITESILNDLDRLDGAIIIGGRYSKVSSQEINKLNAKLIESLKKNSQEIVIIGAEFSDSEHSYIDYFQEYGITGTIDNIESIIGQTALILSLTGQPGNYGVKTSAQQLIPSISIP